MLSELSVSESPTPPALSLMVSATVWHLEAGLVFEFRETAMGLLPTATRMRYNSDVGAVGRRQFSRETASKSGPESARPPRVR